MSRSTAIALLLVGTLLFLGSCAPLGYVFYHEVITSPSQDQPLLSHAASFTFQAPAGTRARIALEADISTNSVQEDPDGVGQDYLARFRFPVTYTIRSGGGAILSQGNRQFAWKQGLSLSRSNEKVSSTGGTLTASTRLDKFTVPGDGTVVVDIEIGPDTTYQAQWSSASLQFYEGVLNNTAYLVTGVLMLLLGFLLAILGFIFLAIRTAQSNAEASPGTASTNHKARQEAMIIHLSALSGYFIPFGSLVVPLVLWLIWREKDPYLDAMGKEAVNFQLSMLLYYLVAFILCFVLIGFFLLVALFIFQLACIIIAATQASKGMPYRYPLSIRFFRQEKALAGD